MNNTVIISSQAVDEGKLHDLIEQLDDLAEANTHVALQFVVTSDKPAILAALWSLFEEPATAPVAVETVKPKRIRRTKVKQQKAAKKLSDVRSWDLVATGERISSVELNRRLAQHSIDIGTTLRHPKFGTKFVQHGGGQDQPYVLASTEDGS